MSINDRQLDFQREVFLADSEHYLNSGRRLGNWIVVGSGVTLLTLASTLSQLSDAAAAKILISLWFAFAAVIVSFVGAVITFWASRISLRLSALKYEHLVRYPELTEVERNANAAEINKRHMAMMKWSMIETVIYSMGAFLLCLSIAIALCFATTMIID